MPPPSDLVGRRFGALVVLGPAPVDKHPRWLTRCAAEGPPRTMAKNAIAAWNKRAPPNEAQVEAAKLAIWTSLHDSFSDRQRKVIDFHAYPFNTHNHKELI